MTNVKPIERLRTKEKLGYALGDTAGLLTFSLVSSFLQMFYTDSLHIPLAQITLLMTVARVWDAINDPVWGGFIDSRKTTRHGRFRPYILGASVPLALAAILMFTKLPGLSQNGYIIFAYITYIFFGMMYTGTNIPYGALATVITTDPIERSSLSVWRGLGAGLGGLPALMLLPLLVYDKNESGIKVLNSEKLFYAVTILAFLSIAVYFLNFQLTKERVTPPANQKNTDYSFFKSFKSLITNRPFVTISLASMFLIASQMYTQTIYNYLFKDYYQKPELYIFVTVCTYLPMGILVLFINKLVRKYGKKELCSAGMAFTAIINFVMFFAGKTSLSANPVFFLLMLFFSGLGQTFLVMEVWACVMDVTDYHELLTGRKEEGTVYSVYNFIRKIGHTIAGAGSSYALLQIGYDVNSVNMGQGKEVTEGLYNLATLVPALMYLAMYLLLRFGYPLTKAKLEELNNKH